MASNPNPSRVTDELWRFWTEFKALEPSVELGGIYANKSGYHNSRNANSSSNYSVREAEDQSGPGDKSAAIDLTFPDAQRGDYRTINKYCQRLLASSKDSNDPRLDDIREWYGQTDSDSHVEGWDCRHLLDITSDNSHLWHIHISVDRGKVAIWATYAKVLSVLRGETVAQWRAGTGASPTPVPAPTKPTTPVDHAPGSRALRLTKPNMQGDDVKFVQRWIGPARAGAPDGVYGPRTESAVRWYQKLRSITVDGICGVETFRQMGIK